MNSIIFRGDYQGLPFLTKQRAKAESRLNKNINKLPEGEMRDQAIKIVNKREWKLFDRKTAITYHFFPYRTEKVDTGRGYSSEQEVVHPYQSTWEGLKGLGKKLQNEKYALLLAELYVLDIGKDNFKFNESDDSGEVHLTKHQNHLLSFAPQTRVRYKSRGGAQEKRCGFQGKTITVSLKNVAYGGIHRITRGKPSKNYFSGQ